jgi:hypothetical protein
VDVTASYPKKELILQDFMDVEYIALETNDEFLTVAYVQAIGKEVIVMRNLVWDGNIFFFDKRSGNGLRKINRKGQGSEEYVYPQKVSLDEDNYELFVNDNNLRKVFVYDLFGKFKRSFSHKEKALYSRIYRFDQDNLICIDRGGQSINKFLIISRLDGSVTEEIQLPYKERKRTTVEFRNEAGHVSDSWAPLNEELIPCGDSWILVEPSSDTIYSYSPNHAIKPFIVRTPSIQSMEPEIFLFPGVLTNRYYFMQTVKREYDFTTRTDFPRTDLMYDRLEKKMYECIVYNDDFTVRTPVNLVFELAVLTLVNKDITLIQKLEAPALIEAYEKGELKGRLKEIAATLNEESNPVIMLAKHKK